MRSGRFMRDGSTLHVLCVFMVAGILVAGCQRGGNEKETKEQKSPAKESEGPKISVAQPARKTIRRVIKRPGYNIESYQSTALYSKISGYVLKWNFDIGDTVEPDAIMAELWVPEMEVDVERREAALEQAKAEIRQAKAAKLRAEALERFTKSQYERLEKIGDSAVAKESIAENRYSWEGAKAGVAKAAADESTAIARFKVAEKSRNYARTLLDYAKIRAPYKGVVTQRTVNDRDFVQPPNGPKTKPLFVIDQVDPVRVFVNVPDVDAVWITNGMTAIIRTQALPGRDFQGTVTRTSRSLDPATRTLRTEIDLPNPKREILPGMYVDISIHLERRNVWTLAASSVFITPESTYCYRLEGSKAVRTLLRIGLQGNTDVEIRQVQSSPTPGAPAAWESPTGTERILIGDLSTVHDGQEVNLASQ